MLRWKIESRGRVAHDITWDIVDGVSRRDAEKRFARLYPTRDVQKTTLLPEPKKETTHE